jgi:hypothetical protein
MSDPSGHPHLDPAEYRERLRVTVQAPDLQPQPISKSQGGFVTSITHCNKFVDRVAGWFGYKGFEDTHNDPVLAVRILGIMKSDGHWSPLLGEDRWKWATDHACFGQLVVAAAEPPPGEQHGHVNVIAPEPDMVESGHWGKAVSKCANAGNRNFYGEGENFAFKVEPALFLYIG